MLLCQVCSYWRQVALSVAVLWSSFDFVLTYETKWSHVALLQRWLTRSRTHPISFSLIPTRRAAALRKALFANVQRWRHIQFRLDAELGQDFLKIDAEQAHLLERVSMTIDPRNWEDERLPSILASFPCLHHLQWTGKYIPATFVNTLWPRLSHIKLVACVISTSDFLALLSHCPTVEHIEAHRPLKSLGSPPAGPSITVPNLQSLAFWADDPGEILDNLTLPCLRSLTTQPPRDPKALQRLDYRSSCKLEAFEMTDYGLTDDDALLYLRLPCMQSLRSLKLGSGAVTDRLVELLTWNPSSHADRVCALPRLTHLTLNMWKTTDGKVGEMISSRWHHDDHYSDHPVSLMDLDLDYEPDDYLIEDRLISKGVEHHALDFTRFEQLAAHGLEITWHCSCFTSWDYIRT
ncbi:hypothetical protein Hypma_016507 [Hypsizygus marmoreus]|uniref:F-box/LRR-repeat protein 15/At3g58940/PEG3-like LRR domain-containing protein n=1 Tax=Hypsizygus marmoreus TaxID=39966 RepID=A0A369IZW6_HYPMA|nr:hypothetical protein Hypma_016507 [Hypsizygus marmoreus]